MSGIPALKRLRQRTMNEFKNNLSYRARNFLRKRENICERRREGERDEKQTERMIDPLSSAAALTELLDVRG